MDNIKFKQYSIIYKHHSFKLLIPYKQIDTFWVTPHTQDPTYWDGDRFAFKTLLEAAKIMSYDPNVIVYFPLKKAKYSNWWNKMNNTHDLIYDMVWMNDKHNIPLSAFKKIKRKSLKNKSIKFYDKRSDKWILNNINKHHFEKEYSYTGCPFEIEYQDIFYYRLSLDFYAHIVLDIQGYLEKTFEANWWDDNILEFDSINAIPNDWFGHSFYYKNRNYGHCIEVGFIDMELVNRLNQYNKYLIKQINNYYLSFFRLLVKTNPIVQDDDINLIRFNDLDNHIEIYQLFWLKIGNKRIDAIFYDYLSKEKHLYLGKSSYKIYKCLQDRYKTLGEMRNKIL